MIETILATDISNHVKNVNALKTKLDTFGISKGNNVSNLIFDDNVTKTYENQQTVLSMCVHVADISNSAKPENISKTWIAMEFEELFNQGDLERQQNLPISLLCDRKTTPIYKSQIGFIKPAVIPAFELIIDITPESSCFMDNLRDNLEKFEKIAKEEQNS